MNEAVVKTPHGRVAVADYGGSGPDVLLLHGSTRTLADWGLVRPYLHGRRIVAMDFRWHGLSTDEGDVGLESNLDDVESVIDELGLENPVIAGHSLGGMVAAVYGARHPESPGVINLDGHGAGTPEQYPGISEEQLRTFRAQVQAMVDSQANSRRSGDDEWRNKLIVRGTAQFARLSLPPEVTDEFIRRTFIQDQSGTWNLRPSHEYNLRFQASITADPPNMFAVYEACDCPLLVYNCSRIGTMPIPGFHEIMTAYHKGLARDLSALSSRKPNIRVKTPDASHFMVYEIPEEVAEDILSFTL